MKKSLGTQLNYEKRFAKTASMYLVPVRETGHLHANAVKKLLLT